MNIQPWKRIQRIKYFVMKSTAWRSKLDYIDVTITDREGTFGKAKGNRRDSFRLIFINSHHNRDKSYEHTSYKCTS